MSLRSRLSRLGSPPAAPPPGPPTGPPAEPRVEPSADTLSIGALRDRIAAVVARGRDRTPTVIADPSAGELPFTRHETSSGPLYRRIVRYPGTHRVGRFCVQDARTADAGMLALLALDPTLADVDPAGLLYLDTETTGLAGGTGTVPFLLGMARFEDDGALVLEQLLLRRLGEEAPILERLLTEVQRASAFVSYNGKSFDLPLLRSRLVMARLPPLPPLPHLDLVHVARRVHRDRLRSANLVGVEEHVLGYVRVGDVPGGEVVERYRHFLRTGDDSALVGVVDHNEWDIVALAALVGLYGAPFGAMHAEDLAGVARTLRRARSLDLAADAATEAVERGGGAVALRERAEVARARGERDRAVTDLERLVVEVDHAGDRLALAKLYEHHVGAPEAALALVLRGTTEGEAATKKRADRLGAKAKRKAQGTLPGVRRR